jgi:hypothetical protein
VGANCIPGYQVYHLLPTSSLGQILIKNCLNFRLTCLDAELEVGQPLGVLLAVRVDGRLLARVELRVADAAVVRQVGTRSGKFR